MRNTYSQKVFVIDKKNQTSKKITNKPKIWELSSLRLKQYPFGKIVRKFYYYYTALSSI